MRTITTRARKRGFGGHWHLHSCALARLAGGRSSDAGNTRLQRMGAAACNLRSAGREQPGLTGRRFALIRPRTDCCAKAKESVGEAAREREAISISALFVVCMYYSTVPASYTRRRRVLCLDVTFPHRKHLAHTYRPRVIVMECKAPYGCVVHAYAAQSQHPRPIATDRSRWHDGTSRLCSRNTTRGPCREHDTTMRYPQALHSAVVPLHRCRLVTIHTQELKAC